MNYTKLMAAFFVAVFTVAAPAFAQDADADPPTPDPATPAATPDPAESTGPLYFTSLKDMIVKRSLFIDLVKRMGTGWAEKDVPVTIQTAQGQITISAQKEAVGETLSNVPKGAVKHYQYFGEQDLDSESYVTWLADTHSCEREGDLEITEEVKFSLWSASCKQPLEEMLTVVRTAAGNSQSEGAGNAQFTLDAAEKLLKDGMKLAESQDKEGVIRADDISALIHLAAYMLSFDEWASALGLVNDLDLLIGKPMCNASETVCGEIESISGDGFMVDGQLIPWDTLYVGKPAGGGGGGFNDGFVLAGEFGWTMAFNSKLTTTHMVNTGVALQFNLKDLPIGFRASGGVLGAGGGLASHYTEADKLWTGYFTLGVGYVPMFTDHMGLNLMPKGVVTTSGGGGAMLDVGPTFYLGGEKNVLVAPQASFGYMTLNKPLGGNDTSPLADPKAEGFVLGFGIVAGGRF